VGYAEAPKFDSASHIFQKGSIDSVIVSKNDVKWSFDDLYVDDQSVGFTDEAIKYYTRAVPPNADSDLLFISKFEGQRFTIGKIDSRHIKITLKENGEGRKRTLNFTAFAGNASTKISIIQGP